MMKPDAMNAALTYTTLEGFLTLGRSINGQDSGEQDPVESTIII